MSPRWRGGAGAGRCNYDDRNDYNDRNDMTTRLGWLKTQPDTARSRDGWQAKHLGTLKLPAALNIPCMRHEYVIIQCIEYDFNNITCLGFDRSQAKRKAENEFLRFVDDLKNPVCTFKKLLIMSLKTE